jgi:hypothetical protein
LLGRVHAHDPRLATGAVDDTEGTPGELDVDEGTDDPASGEAGCGPVDRTRCSVHVASVNRS